VKQREAIWELPDVNEILRRNEGQPVVGEPIEVKAMPAQVFGEEAGRAKNR
jgi:hypothetical protein